MTGKFERGGQSVRSKGRTWFDVVSPGAALGGHTSLALAVAALLRQRHSRAPGLQPPRRRGRIVPAATYRTPPYPRASSAATGRGATSPSAGDTPTGVLVRLTPSPAASTRRLRHRRVRRIGPSCWRLPSARALGDPRADCGPGLRIGWRAASLRACRDVFLTPTDASRLRASSSPATPSGPSSRSGPRRPTPSPCSSSTRPRRSSTSRRRPGAQAHQPRGR